jgi:hypothetical protein
VRTDAWSAGLRAARAKSKWMSLQIALVCTSLARRLMQSSVADACDDGAGIHRE